MVLNPPPLHHFVSQVLMDEGIYAEKTETPNVVIPVLRVRIITVNGEIWSNIFKAFGLTEQSVIEHWDANGSDLPKAGWQKI
jgi:hypothetical protein